MSSQIAFLSEYGNNSFEFAHSATHFIVAALMVDRQKQAEAEQHAAAVLGTLPGKKPLFANGDPQKLRLLAELLRPDFRLFAIVIDKQRMEGEGFRYKEPFFRFVSGFAEQELYRRFPNLMISGDNNPTSGFLEAFSRQVETRHVPDLFNQSHFRMISIESPALQQVSELVSDVISEAFDETRRHSNSGEIMRMLKRHLVDVRFFPAEYQPYQYESLQEEGIYNPVISSLGMNLANSFIAGHINSAIPYEIDQLNCVKFLLFYFKTISPVKYISTFEIIKHIEAGRPSPVTAHYFRSKIIAKLRDAGVIIASSSAGYKLPASESDLYDFISHSNTIIQPMISRIKQCRDIIRKATGSELDILEKSQFSNLSRFLDGEVS